MPRRMGSLAWRTLAAAAGGLLLAVVLAMVALALGGNAADIVAADTGSAATFGLALLPTLGLVAATIVGAVCGVSVIAAMVRDVFAGQPPRLAASWARAWASLPRLLALGAGASVAVVVSAIAWPVLSAAVVLRALWRLRSSETRPTARRGLWWAVPGAPTLAVVAAVAPTWSALLSGAGLREALREILRAPLRSRAGVLVGIAVFGLASYLLGRIGLAISAETASADTNTFAVGTAGLGATTTALLVIAGALLGALAHWRRDAPTPPARAAAAGWNPTGAHRARFWRGARVSVTAAMVSATILLPTTMTGAITAPAAVAAEGELPTQIRVSTLADASTPAEGECVDDDADCGVRAAMALAQSSTEAGEQVDVIFDVAGVVRLAETLRIPAGVTLTATGVTFDAHHDFGAIEAFTVQETYGAQIAIRGLTVTGGRSDWGGAGLASSNVRVVLDEVEFVDNVSDTGDPDQTSDGGAVAVPYSTLTVRDSLFADNHARTGVGGAAAASTLNWSNSTAVNNTGMAGRPEGGALYAEYGGRVTHATILGGGGVSGSDEANLTVDNSAISAPDPNGAFSCARITDPTDPEGPSAGNVDPNGTCLGRKRNLAPLGTLADNGGPTRTVALLPGSPAIGAADSSLCAATDQRGNTRTPARCDAGAFQRGPGDIAKVNVTVAAPETVDVGEKVPVTVTLASAAAIPAGTVTVRVDGKPAAEDLAVTGNEVVTAIDALAQGPHEIRAAFVPDDGTPDHVSAPVSVTVRAETTLTVTADESIVVLRGPATLRATLTSPDAAPGTPPFTGTVTFTAGDTTHTSPVGADGSATWHVARLPAAWVEATYDGDGHHGAVHARTQVTTGHEPSLTTVAVAPAQVAFGEDVTITGTMTDEDGQPLAGSATLLVDGTRHAEEPVGSDGAFTFVQDLGPGSHDIAVTGTPGPGWAPSTSGTVVVEVTGADVAVSITLDPATSTYADPVTATAVATGVGVDTIELLVDGVAVATATSSPTDADNPVAEFAFTLDQFAVKAGTHRITARVPASSTTSGGEDSATLTVAPAPTTLTLDGPYRGSVGDTVYLGVHVVGGWEAAGTVTVTDQTGRTLVTGDVANSAAYLSWTADVGGTHDLTITFEPAPGDSHLSSSTQASLEIARTAAPPPTLTWSEPVASGTTLTVEFPPSDPPVTGRVTIVDSWGGADVGTAELNDGSATITLQAAAGECYCAGRLTLDYAGDDTYEPSSNALDDLTLPGHETITTLRDLPATAGSEQRLYLFATVTAPESQAIPSGSFVFLAGGTVLATVPVAPDGTALHVFDLRDTAARGRLTIDARYEPDAPAWLRSIATAQVVVEDVVEPSVSLAMDNTRPAIGETSTITVTAVAASQHIPVGSRVFVSDEWGNPLGSATWIDGGGRRIARVDVTWARGGPQQVTASYGYAYGDDSTIYGTSKPLDVAVAGVRSILNITVEGEPYVGSPMRVVVSLDSSARPELATAGLPLELIVDGRVIDSAVMEAGRLRHTFTVTPATRYRTTYEASTPGDGRNYGRGIGQGVITAHGLHTQVGTDPFARASYSMGWKMNVALTAQGSHLPDPTGFVRLTVSNANGQEVAACAVRLPETACQFAAKTLPVGSYAVDVVYDGDTWHAPARMAPPGRLLIDPAALARLDVSYSVDPKRWLVGQRVRATFSAQDPLRATPSGTVAVTQDGYGVLCQNNVAVGGCDLTVPGSSVPLGQRRTPILRATYTPDSGTAPVGDYFGSYNTRHCLGVTADMTVSTSYPGSPPNPTITGTTCSVEGVPGYLEGTEVTVKVAGDIPDGYRTTEWTVEVAGAASTTKTSKHLPVWTFRLLGKTHVRSTLGWAPKCVTLTAVNERLQTRAAYEHDPRMYDPGYLELLTASNCADPGRETPEERVDRQDRGIGRYLVGTVVEVEPFAYRQPTASVTRVEHAPIDVPNTRAPTAAHPHPHVTLTADTSLYARFRQSPQMCTPTRLYSGVGGKMALVKAGRGSGPNFWLEDPQGRCLTAAGERGYLAGTPLTLRATPSNPLTGAPAGQPRSTYYFHDQWLDDTDLGSAQARARALAPTGYGEEPARIPGYDPYRPVEHTVTVPMAGEAGGAHFGASYGNISCAPVSVDVEYPVSSRADPTRPDVRLTPSNCSAEPSSGPTVTAADLDRGESYDGQLVRTEEQVRWYTPGTTVTASTQSETLPDRAGERVLQWAVSDKNRSDDPVRSLSATVTTTIEAGQDLRIRGQYVSTACKAPSVKVYPKGIGRGYQVLANGSCPEGESDTNKLTSLYADGGNGRLLPVWQVVGGADAVPPQGGRRPSNSWPIVVSAELTYRDTTPASGASPRPVYLHYCARLDVKVQMVDSNGKTIARYVDPKSQRVYTPPKAEDILTDGDDCPEPMMVHAGTTAEFGASGALADRWEVTGYFQGKNKVSGVPHQSVGVDGTITGGHTAVVTPRCAHLDAGSKVGIGTAVNCPGATQESRLFLIGTPVELQFTGEKSFFEKWKGTDASEDTLAVVVMNGDRTVTAAFHSPSKLELVASVITILEQGVIAGLINVATGIATGFLFIAQVAALAIIGVAYVLEAAGVPDSVTKPMKASGEAVQAGLDMVNALADCTTEWATGGAAPPLSPSSYQGAQGVAVGSGLAGELAEEYGSAGFQDGLGAAGDAVDLVNLFGAGGVRRYYVRDLGDSWAGVADIGSCIRDVGYATRDAGLNVVN